MHRADVLIAGFSVASVAAALTLAEGRRVVIFELLEEHPLRGLSEIGETPLNASPIAGHEFDVLALAALKAKGVIVASILCEGLIFDPRDRLFVLAGSVPNQAYYAAPRLLVSSCGRTPALPTSLVVDPDLWGAGLSTCAWSDGPSYRGRHVVVIGSGHWALNQVRLLLRTAHRLTVIEEAGRPDRYPPLPAALFEAVGAAHTRLSLVRAVEPGEGAGGILVRGDEGIELSCGAVFFAPDLVPACPPFPTEYGLHVPVEARESVLCFGVEAGVPYFAHSDLFERGALAAQEMIDADRIA